MNTVRMNITLPYDVAQILSGVKNKSAYIADALTAKKEAEEKERSKKQLEMAYKQAALEDYECYKEWEDTVTDGISE
ncbi:MAG: hypothetical protein HQK89_12970 [Nitrospirae bacterium]|nr:hypothetical protein [Nitrospirota bacterium]